VSLFNCLQLCFHYINNMFTLKQAVLPCSETGFTHQESDHEAFADEIETEIRTNAPLNDLLVPSTAAARPALGEVQYARPA
jgi:hypothetical protein